MTFYSQEEVRIAYNEGRLNMQAPIKVRMDVWEDGKTVRKIIDTTVGRVFFNDVVPFKAGYINTVIKKNNLRDIIAHVLKCTDIATTTKFLDDIKAMGYYNAFRGGLSFSLADILIPEQKAALIEEANEKVETTMDQYNMGAITNNERYNIIIDAWSAATNLIAEAAMKTLKEDKQGFNSVYMMLDSGARGSKAQISQLTGMRGLMAKPQKSGSSGADIIENPIISNFKEGLSILEFFISTHGARKGLADTALKTADAGYLTRRLVDVAQDVIVNEEDCGTLRGIEVSALKENDVVRESLSDRILGRVSLHDVENPADGSIIVKAGEEITETFAKQIEAAGIETVEVRSPLTCEARHGICAKCYGRNLASGRMVQKGEAVGVIAAQSIGEPGTQLTLRTFHQGGTAGSAAAESSIKAKADGVIEFDDLRSIPTKDQEGNDCEIVISRTTEMRITDPKTKLALSMHNIPYGALLYAKDKSNVEKGTLICTWDPHNAIILSETAGKIVFEDIEQGQSYQIEIDDQTGFQEKIISESKNKKLIPTVIITDPKGEVIKSYNLPVGAHLMVDNGAKVKAGQILVKIPRKSAKAGDITGGLPRVTELFEARNPSNPAIVAEIDGVVKLGAIKRGNKEIIITSKNGEEKRYLVKLSNQILVQDNDYVRAGDPLSEGAISPDDILRIKGPNQVQEYLVNEVQGVYRMQGVVINDKHFEVIVRQMMRKVMVIDPGDTQFLEGQSIHKRDFTDANDALYGIKVVTDAGDSENLKPGQMVTLRQLKDENSTLKRADKKLVEVRDALPATAEPMLQGITRASLQTHSFISAASFQETTKVLNEAAVAAKEDYLEGLKENVIVGHKIPAGTGLREYEDLIVGSKEEYEQLRKETSATEE